MPSSNRTSIESGASQRIQNVWWPTLCPLNTTFTLKMVSNSAQVAAISWSQVLCLQKIEVSFAAMALSSSSYTVVLPLSSPSRNSWGKDHIWKVLKHTSQSHRMYNSDRLAFLSLDRSEEACACIIQGLFSSLLSLFLSLLCVNSCTPSFIPIIHITMSWLYDNTDPVI